MTWTMGLRWCYAVPDHRAERFIADTNALRGPGILSSHAGSHGPGSWSPWSLTWDLTLITDGPGRPHIPEVDELLDRWSTEVEVTSSAVLTPRAWRQAHGDDGIEDLVHRVLLLRVAPSAPQQQIRALEASLLRMPDHIPVIRSWSLSTVSPASRRYWTHCWRQTYRDAADLVDPDTPDSYLAHPYHVTNVDAFFDPHNPRRIVDDFSHAYYIC
ncbi:Dabb family protein [Streptomyces sp. SM12]|uniref:Dabb family protein n=1 Tax=Streptomyces sp. SM12 TaxID=1071602 RepID=UPI000CD4CC8C|nr:Dabb family protein [Streptomyces sp. SM12]